MVETEKKVFFKKFISLLLPSIVTVVLLGIGALAGYYLSALRFNNLIANQTKSYTVGSLTKHAYKKSLNDIPGIDGFLECYENQMDPEMLNNFSWAPPPLPTPFVGSGAMPGKHNNATINSLQMRTESEIIIPKPKNTYRIFITGGSTAYGSAAASQDKTIGALLNTLLNNSLSPTTKTRFEVFTMAYPSWTTTHERIIIENLLSELEPDMVISFSGINDVHWAARGQDIYWMRTYADQYFWDMIQSVYRLTGHEQMPDNINVLENFVPPYIVAEKLAKNVKLSSYALSMKGSKYIFVLQPTLSVTQKRLTARESKSVADVKGDVKDLFKSCYLAFNHQLQSIREDNFYYVDLTGAFDSLSEKDEFFLDSYHFGDKGNRIIAVELFRHIRPVIMGR